jgi:tetratricopeptide (TPR) repeat protein
VSEVAGHTFGLIGALVAFPRRLAAREVRRQGGELQHRVTRRTTRVVFGRSLLKKLPEADVESRWDRHASSRCIMVSERGLLELLGLVESAAGRNLSQQSILDQSGLSSREFGLLAAFDAFESSRPPHTFRDLILARKYASLLADGASWSSIARSVHQSGPIGSLAAVSLETAGGNAIYARSGPVLSELNGQALLPLDLADDADLDDLFANAEEAEDEERFLEAAALYQRCLDLDPSDAMAAFNRANCLRGVGEVAEARQAYMRAIRLDPKFVEAWFNLGCLDSDEGNASAARRHLNKAIEVDPQYADPIFNLASLEFETGNLPEARRWWARYLELDSSSDWARKAANGIQYADYQLNQRTAG